MSLFRVLVLSALFEYLFYFKYFYSVRIDYTYSNGAERANIYDDFELKKYFHLHVFLNISALYG